MQTPDTTIALLDGAAASAPAAQGGLDAVMLAGDKMPVVLAVVLVVWIGILFVLVRTERQLARVERELDEASR